MKTFVPILSAGGGNVGQHRRVTDESALAEAGVENTLDQFAGVTLLLRVMNQPVRGQRVGAQFDLLEGESDADVAAGLPHS